MQIQGKVAVITGGARGFGKRLAEVLISKGARVVLGDLLEAEGQKTAQELNSQHASTKAIFQTCDVTKPEDLQALIARAIKEFGYLDIMVNNAGIGGSIPWEAPYESLALTIDVNLKAPLEGTRQVVDYFRKNNRPGCVVNVASMMAFFPAEFGPIYGATKSGLVNFTASCATLALLEGSPIRVNAVAPNFADTDMVRNKTLSGPQNKVFATNGILTVDEVVDQMVRCIEDEKLAGDTIKILPGMPPLVHKGRKAVPSGVITKAKL